MNGSSLLTNTMVILTPGSNKMTPAQIPELNNKQVSSDQIQTEKVNCPLCGSIPCETLFIGRDMLHGTAGEWPVVRCRNCSLVYTNPRPTIESLSLVYPRDYSRYRPPRPTKKSIRWRLQQWALSHHWNYPPHKSSLFGKISSWPFFLWTKYKRRNLDLFPWVGQGKLLDFGCGSGKYLQRMNQRGWQVTGMDISEQAVDVCRQLGYEAYVGTEPAQKFPAKSFDVVTLWHVLEHVPQPINILQQIHTILTENGQLILALPNIASPLARWFGKYWFAWELPRHLAHFDPDTITKMLEMTGFRVDKIFNQKYGQTVQTSCTYLVRDTGKIQYRILSKSKRLSYLVDILSQYRGQGGIMIIHARKSSKKTEI